MDIDTRRKKIMALRLRAKSIYYIKDARYLIKRLQTKLNKLVANKKCDAEWLHRYCYNLSIKAGIHMKNYGNKPIYIGKSLRRRYRKNFNNKTYHRMEMSKSVFSSFKRRFRPSVRSVNITT